MTFICACLLGCGLTADSISEEKREGTLGLLFLTNLNASSIALGKLAAHGLLALYSIVAVIPIMTVPVLMGGGDLQSLATTVLVLLLTLGLGLLLGLLASTVCRRAWVASAISLLCIGILTLVLPGMAELLRLAGVAWWPMMLEAASPSYALSMASWTARSLPSSHLGLALAVQTVLLFLLAGTVLFLLPRVWQDRSPRGRLVAFRKGWENWKFGSGTARQALRERLLKRNPILWLCARSRFAAAGFALLVFGVGASVSICGAILPEDFISPLFLWLWAVPLLHFALCFRIAAAASERFTADRKTGALELLLCTPLRVERIVRGQWLALLRHFWGGALILLLLHAFVLNYIVDAFALEMHRPFSVTGIIRGALRHVLGQQTIENPITAPYICTLAVLTAGFLIMVLWIALGWLAMFLSLKVQRHVFASWGAILVLALPPIPVFLSFAFLFVWRRWFGPSAFSNFLFLGVAGFTIVLANALLWMLLARRWIFRHFRTAAAGELSRSAIRKQLRIRDTIMAERRDATGVV